MPHYKIVITKRKLGDLNIINETMLSEKFTDFRMCNQRIKQIADAQLNLWPSPANRVMHFAGLSVAYYARSLYTEYSRSELLYDEQER